MSHTVCQILPFARQAKELQVVDTLSDGQALLMSVHHASEFPTFPLATSSLAQEILILCEQHPAKSTGSVQQLVVGQPLCAVLFSGPDINTPSAKALGDRPLNVMVHIE